MKITPIINENFMFRYMVKGNTIVDTFINKELVTGKTQQAVQKMLQDINRIGLLNGHIIDHNAKLPKAQQAKLLNYMA